MKKLIVSLLFVFVLSITFCSASFAMFNIDARVGSYNTASDGSLSMVGGSIGMPSLIPMTEARLEVMYGTLPNRVNISGYNIQFSVIPITYDLQFNLPFTGSYVGAEIGYCPLIVDVPKTVLYPAGYSGAAPGGMIYGTYVGYKKRLAPMVTAFGQVGWHSANFNVDISQYATIPGLTSFTRDFSGTNLKAGISIGL